MTKFVPYTMSEARELKLWEWTREQSRDASWNQAKANVYGNGGWRNRITSRSQNFNGTRGSRLRSR